MNFFNIICYSIIFLLSAELSYSEEASFEGSAGDSVHFHENVEFKLSLEPSEGQECIINFFVQNTGEYDVLIHSLGKGNNHFEIKKPDGTFWKQTSSKMTHYKRFKPGDRLRHTQFYLKQFFEYNKLMDDGKYEFQWVVRSGRPDRVKWKSNVLIYKMKDGNLSLIASMDVQLDSEKIREGNYKNEQIEKDVGIVQPEIVQSYKVVDIVEKR